MHLNLGQSSNNNSFDWIFSKIKDIIRHHNQVLNIFVVYFQKTDPNGILTLNLMRFHLLENFLHRVEHNSRVLLISKHGVGLACSSLPISKNRRVVPIEHSFAQKLSGILKHFQLLRVFVKCEVKRVLLLLGSILAEYFLLVHDVGWVHQYYDIRIKNLDDAYLAFLNFFLPHRTESDRHHYFIYPLPHFANIVLVSQVTTTTITHLRHFLFFLRTSEGRMILAMAWVSKFANFWLVEDHGLGIGMRQILAFVIHWFL